MLSLSLGADFKSSATFQARKLIRQAESLRQSQLRGPCVIPYRYAPKPSIFISPISSSSSSSALSLSMSSLSLAPARHTIMYSLFVLRELLKKKQSREEEEIQRKRIRTRLEVSTDPMRDQKHSSGDQRLAKIRTMLDNLGLVRSEDQRLFHEWFIRATLHLIYGQEDFQRNHFRIMKENAIDRIRSEVLIVTPRRFGKTTSVALFVTALLLCVPGITIAIFSTGKRASTGLTALVRKFFTTVQGAAERVCSSNQEQLYVAQTSLPPGKGISSAEAKALSVLPSTSRLFSFPGESKGYLPDISPLTALTASRCCCFLSLKMSSVYPTEWIYHRYLGSVRKRKICNSWRFKGESLVKDFNVTTYGGETLAFEAAENFKREWAMEDPIKRTYNSYRHISDDKTEMRAGPNGHTTIVNRNKVDIIISHGIWGSKFDDKKDEWYIECSSKRLALHRFLTNCPKGLEVDHLDGCTTNNCIENLLVTTHRSNMNNIKTYSNNTSGVTGVSLLTHKKGWVAHWRDEDGKQRNKTFRFDPSVQGSKERAFEAACKYREARARELGNENGIRPK